MNKIFTLFWLISIKRTDFVNTLKYSNQNKTEITNEKTHQSITRSQNVTKLLYQLSITQLHNVNASSQQKITLLRYLKRTEPFTVLQIRNIYKRLKRSLQAKCSSTLKKSSSILKECIGTARRTLNKKKLEKYCPKNLKCPGHFL
nr:uncharacterized protein LOC124818738 [Hydra vulgaris]